MLRAIIEATPVAIIGLDLDGLVHSVWNPAAEKMLDWRAQEVMGKPLPTVPADHKEEFTGFREQIRQGMTLDGVEVRRQRRDGTPIDYNIYVYTMPMVVSPAISPCWWTSASANKPIRSVWKISGSLKACIGSTEPFKRPTIMKK
jgi:PAS domain S-box-containing protein